ncbi:MAG: hypothetical protein Q6373_019735 [Candidatus Sigynarchaeota archaeon]
MSDEHFQKGDNAIRAAFSERAGSRLISLLVFIMMLGAGYLFSEYMAYPIAFTFTITETGQLAVFLIYLGDLLEIVTWSFGLVIAGFFLFAVNVRTWEWQSLISPRKKEVLFHLFIIATILIAGGNIVHVLFNTFNGMVEDVAGTNVDGMNLFVLVYFIDEQVSHAMIHCGIMLILGVVLASEPVADLPGEVTSAKARATMLAMLLGFAMGAIQALAALEGQCALIVLAGSWAILITSLSVHYKLGSRSFDTLRPFERPNLGFLFCLVVSLTIVVVLWGLIFGFWPAYPFFKQPGELF